MSQDPEAHVRGLASGAQADGDPNRWFEELYAAAERGEAVVPWDRGGAHPLLERWVQERFEAHPLPGAPRAMVVGCGHGHDAVLLDGIGCRTTAFDLSGTAVAAAARGLRDTSVELRQADLLDLPDAWRGGFDLVVEAMTVQAMPRSLRPRATAAVRSLVAPAGVLLVIGVHQPEDRPLDDGPPWLLTREEIDAFADDGISPVAMEEQPASEDGLVRYLAELRRG